MATSSTPKKADKKKAGTVYGLNPASGGGVVIYSAVDSHGYELLDLSSGQREKVALGDDPIGFADVDTGGAA